ncbi:hypothetical protein HH1059_20660 [Halorhodospira halochloris]|uniref:Uncharacterized protein n=1 Tax=Halorhodospira halochloris TaxID=1052 RepID=A0A0X8XBC6_HALHR|nr:hypothetical protein [Halorhodospira halochloris]BAU58774.1 hypothetical protein HH1059_20660 [Halorhodospira halochloris]
MLLDEGAEQGPEVRVCCRPSGVSVCTATYRYPDTPEGLLEAQGDFEAFDDEQAFEVARQMFVQMAAKGACDAHQQVADVVIIPDPAAMEVRELDLALANFSQQIIQ